MTSSTSPQHPDRPAEPRTDSDQDQAPDAVLTAVSVLDTLVRAGMRHVVLCPGSRSAPLAYALAAADAAGALSLQVRIDERSAGFTALGLARASGRPVGVVTTSGTAVGELLPAVMEAFMAEAPVAVLSADRPPRLRGTGANQTTWQPGIFGTHVRSSVDLTAYPEERPGAQTAGFMRCLADLTGRSPEDWSRPSGQPLGPVQINCAFDVPLAPDQRRRGILSQWAESLVGLDLPRDPRPVDATGAEGLLPARADGTAREPEHAVVVAGDGAGDLARRFAEARALPLLAEPSSSAHAGPQAVPAAPAVLRGPLGEKVRKVLVFGRPTLSRPVLQLLAREDVRTAAYRPQPVAWAEAGRRREEPLQTLAEAAEFVGAPDEGWLHEWTVAGEQAAADVRSALADAAPGPGLVLGPDLARLAWEASAEDRAVLLCGSSNLVRDLELVARPAEAPGERGPVPVFANRGLAGIDGTLATAAGISLARADAAGNPAPVRVLLGDLTFLHDAGSLLVPRTERVPNLQVVVLNDAGGGIFSTLEHGQVGRDADWADAIERVFGTPHDADLGALVRGYGHEHVLAAGLEAARRAIACPWTGIRVIEVPGTRAGLADLHQVLREGPSRRPDTGTDAS